MLGYTLGSVYTGAARAEAAMPLDLSGLATGIYYLQVRNSTAASVRKVSLTR